VFQIKSGTFYPELQHQAQLKGQSLSSKMINEQSLINLIKDMSFKHFTLEQRNELSALLRDRVKEMSPKNATPSLV